MLSSTEVEALVSPVSLDRPAGALIQYEYDVELELLATRVPERALGADTEAGAQRLAAIEPDWFVVEQRARELLSKSKDARFIVLLARALCNRHGVMGLHMGLKIAREIVCRYWDCMHPGLDELEARMNQFADLFDPEHLKVDLRERVFFRSVGLGAVLVRDVEAALGRYPSRPDAVSSGEAQIRDAILSLAHDEREALIDSVQGALTEIEQLEEVLSANQQNAIAPDMSVMKQTLLSLAEVLPSVDVADAVSSPSPNKTMASGSVSGRGDVMRMLDRACEYLEQHEPSNPAPLLIRRAKALIGKDFLQIIEALAPAGVDQVRVVAGIRE